VVLLIGRRYWTQNLETRRGESVMDQETEDRELLGDNLRESLRELVSYEIERIVDENNEWFMEMLKEVVVDCLEEQK